MKEKAQKDLNDFWCRKYTLKIRFWHFLTPPHYTNSQNSMISFDYCWFLSKNLYKFVSFAWKLHNLYCLTERALANAPIIINRDSQLFKNYQQQRIPRRADNMGPPNPHKKRGKSGSFQIMWYLFNPENKYAVLMHSI